MEKDHDNNIQLLDLSTMMNARDLFSFNFIIQDSGPSLAYFPHYHDYYEIQFYYGKKPVTYRAGNDEYEASYGDILLCDMFEPHMFMMSNCNNHEHLTLGINASVLVSLSNNEYNLVQIFDKKKRAYPILHLNTIQFSKYLDIIKTLYNNDVKRCTNLLERALVTQILTYLYEDTYEEQAVDNVSVKGAALVSQVKQYIDLNISNRITLDDLAEVTNYSSGHLCHMFKRVSGKTLIQYINEKRVQKAKELILKSVPMTEVAYQTGFEAYSYFYKVFKQYVGINPTEYRQKNT